MEFNFKDDFEEDSFSCLNKCIEILKIDETSDNFLQEFFSSAENLNTVLDKLQDVDISVEGISVTFNFFTEFFKCIATSSSENVASGLIIVKKILETSSNVLIRLWKSGSTESSVGVKFLSRAAMVSEDTALEIITSSLIKGNNFKIDITQDENRKWIFRLILVFLNKETCIKELCKSGLFQRFLRYLIEEKDSSIEKVLTTMHEKILLGDVSKEMKLSIFSTMQLQSLFPIYNMACCEQKKKCANEAFHELMLTLYCDTKYGIVSHNKYNIGYLTLLSSKKSFLLTTQGKELIKGSISKWSNLMSHVISKMENDINTIAESESDNLESLLSILFIIIKDDSIWNTNKRDLKTEDCDLLKKIITSMLEHELSTINVLCLDLLNLLYSKLTSNVKKRFKAFPLLKCLCPIDQILKCWKSLSIEDNKFNISRNVIYVRRLIANILYSYFQVNSELKISSFISISDILQDLSETFFDAEHSSNYIHTSYYLIHLASLAKSRENLLILDINMTFSEILSSSPLSSMCKLYVAWQQSIDIILVSKHTSATENIFLSVVTAELNALSIKLSESELKIWLREIGKGDNQILLQFFLYNLTEAIKLSHVYRPVLYSLQKSPEHCIEEENLLSTIDEEDCIDNEDVCVIPIIEPFSLLVLSAIDILTNKTNVKQIKYFSVVMQHYIHTLSSPEILAKKLLSVSGILSVDVKSYMENFMADHNSEHSIKSANLPVRLDVIFKMDSCPKLKNTTDSLISLLTKEVDNEFLCSQILYYVKSDKYKSNQNKRPKHLKFFCNLLTELLKIWHTSNILSPLKFLLSNSFMLESYSPFVDADCLNQLIICLLVLSSKETCLLLDSMKAYGEKTIQTFNKFASIGDTDVFSPFEIFINTSFLTYTQLEGLINSCSKFPLTENKSICELLTKLMELFNDLTCEDNIPSEHTVTKMAIMMISLDKKLDCAETKNLSENIQKCISKSLMYLKTRNFSPVFKNTIFSCDYITPDLKCQLASMDNLNVKEICAKFLSMDEFDIVAEAPLIAILTRKQNSELTTKALTKCRDALNDWAKCANSKGSPYCEQIIRHLLTKNIIDMNGGKVIADMWYDAIMTRNEMVPSHILNLGSIFEHIGAEYKYKFLLICMYSIKTYYLPEVDLERHAELIANAPKKIISLWESTSFEADDQKIKALFKSFWKQVLKVGLVDDTQGAIYLDCLVQLLPHAKNSGCKLERLFQILCSHSKFNDILLGANGMQIKESVIKLMLALMEERPELCDEKHVPLLLTAYNASLSSCDQYLLKLLQIYEQRDSLSLFPPVVWGVHAKRFFSSKAGSIVKFEDLPDMKYRDILALLKPSQVNRTAMNFDSSLDVAVTKIVGYTENMYDQRYLMLLAKFITSSTQDFHEELLKSNLLTIAIAALTSNVDSVWAIGAEILNNMRACFESKYFSCGKKFFQAEWLIRILGNSMNGKRVRLPSIFAQLLIQMIDCIDTLEKASVKEFVNFLYSKAAMDIYNVKHFKKWLNLIDDSSLLGLQKVTIRIIAHSGKSDADWKLLKKENILAHLFALCMSPNMDINIRCEIFETLHKLCVDSKKFRKYLIENINFFPLLTLMRKDVEESTELVNKAESLATLDSMQDILKKSDNLSLKNMPSIKLSQKRMLEESSNPPQKVQRLSVESVSKEEIVGIKEEDDFYLSEDLDESMCVDEL